MNMYNQLCFRMLLQSSGYTGDTTVLVHTCIQTVPHPCNAHVARNNKPQSIYMYYTDMFPARTPKIMCVSSFFTSIQGKAVQKDERIEEDRALHRCGWGTSENRCKLKDKEGYLCYNLYIDIANHALMRSCVNIQTQTLWYNIIRWTYMRQSLFFCVLVCPQVQSV